MARRTGAAAAAGARPDDAPAGRCPPHRWLIPLTFDAEGRWLPYGDPRRDWTCPDCGARKPDPTGAPNYRTSHDTWPGSNGQRQKGRRRANVFRV